MDSIVGTARRGSRRLAVVLGSLCLAIVVALSGPTLVSLAAPLADTTPDLGAANSFAILAGTPNITNIPTSVITGDVGLSPASGAGIGLTAAEVTGTIYAVDAAGPAGSVTDPALLTAAKNDLGTAYDRLIATDNAPCTVDYGAAQHQLDGDNLGPGIYCVGAGGFDLAAGGNLTLSGSATDIWIFRSESTIVTGTGSTVTGGAACNVWWRAATSVTLGVDSTFIGNVLALQDIALQTNANLAGRALARNGAVTLDQVTITRGPLCVSITDVEEEEEEEAVTGLPDTGGAPIGNEGFPWSLVIIGGASAVALAVGVQAYRRTHLPKQ